MPALKNATRTSILCLLKVPPALMHLGARELSWPPPADSLPGAPGERFRCDVLIAPIEILLSDRFLALWAQLKHSNAGTQLIVISEHTTPPEFLFEVQRELPVFRIYEALDESDLEWGIFEAVERSNWVAQNEQLKTLVQDQTERMKLLYHELEERVQKRQKYLEESRRKNLIAQFRWQTLKQATEAIHESGTVPEMEHALTRVLQESLNLLEVRFVLHQQSSLAQAEGQFGTLCIHRVRLFRDQDTLMGFALFLRDGSWPFTLEEKDFLQKISEAISLAIHRLNQFDITRTLREQWQATFNAITDPVALISSSNEIIQSNTAFQSKMKSLHPNLATGGRHNRLLFDQESPGQSFRLEPNRHRPETWEVTSQSVNLTPGEDPVFFRQYLDITEQQRIEKKLIEGARLAELGIIGSSIAHELNNPLGGILSFVQMMKMDLPKDSPIYSDVEEMEQGVFRCRDIVQNLLGFTRSSNLDEKKEFDLREALLRALSILDLQTRSQGFEARRQLPSTPQMVYGNPNLISQALTNLLQNAVHHMNTNPHKVTPQIEVVMNDMKDSVEVRILDNGVSAPIPSTTNTGTSPGAAPTLSLPLAQQIFLDHDAQLEILLPGKGLRLVKVTLPKAVSKIG